MKKATTILLFCGILLCMFTSCGSPATVNETDEENAVTDTAGETAETEPETHITEMLPDHDYDGYTFRMLATEEYEWARSSLDTEETNGEIINDTVYERNVAVEERYNITIVNDATMDAGKITSTVKAHVQSDSDDYDMVSNEVKHVLQSAASGYYYNLHTVDSIRFDMPWWYTQCVEPLTMVNRLYVAFNVLNIQNLELLSSIYFNNDLVEDYALESPYTLVKEGRWTLDVFRDMAETVKSDLNGDGEMTAEDQFGFVTGIGSFNFMVNGAAQPHVKRGEDGKLVLNYGTETAINAAEKIAGIVNADFSVYLNEQPWGNDVFKAGSALFNEGSLNGFSGYRDLEMQLGIVPSPKYDENQESHYGMMSNRSMGISIPANVDDPALTGVITEAMGAYSIGTLDEAYYDVVLLGKYARDAESIEMIDIIKNNQVVDIGTMNENTYGSIITSWLSTMRSKKGEGLASLAASNQSKFDTLIEGLEADYAKLP